MRRLLYILLGIVLVWPLMAQRYANEWIQFSQRYYKFPITKAGIYRIDSLTLANSGFNVSGVNPKNFQVILKGKELPLYIQGESDNVFNASDFIEFYAGNTMGDVDSLVYDNNIRYMPNPYKGMFNDTVYAFLTTNNLLTNKRFTIESDTNFTGYTPAPYIHALKTYTGNGYYNTVSEFFSGASDPQYTQAEGYGAYLAKGNGLSLPFGVLRQYTVSPLPCYFSINVSGNSADQFLSPDHQFQIFYQNTSNTNVLLFDTAFYGFVPLRKQFVLQTTQLAGVSPFSVTAVASPSFAAADGNFIIHSASLYYPQFPDMGNASFNAFYVDDNPLGAKSLLQLSSTPSGTTNVIIFYDLTNGKRIKVNTYSGAMAKVLVPNGGGPKECVMQTEQAVIKVPKLFSVGNNGQFTYFKNSTLDSAFVIIYHKSLQTGAQAYANYRKSIAGGNRNVILADVGELYEQFAYGINAHPQAIRHFCRYLHDSLPSKPGHVFLLGKGIQQGDLIFYANYSYERVPTMGIPSSDHLLTAYITGTNSYVPQIPIGRIAANTNADILNYLTKVQQHEATGRAEWKRNVLHFCGGENEGLNNLLCGYTNTWADIIKDTSYGARVYRFSKTSSAPIQTNLSDSIRELIDNGVSLITFFGHGSVEGFDQAIDDPYLYNNLGKYPFMLANSCRSGNIFIRNDARTSVSERFVLAPNKGSIGFLASTDLGFVHALANYSGNFYKALSTTKYNRSIGEVIMETAGKTVQLFGSDPITRFTALDVVYHGDPSIVISQGAKPDFEMKNQYVSFDTKKYADSIGLHIILKNNGRAVNDSFYVKVERFFPNGDTLTVYHKRYGILNSDTLRFYMQKDFFRGIGLNKFAVTTDAFNFVNEAAETNNATIGTVDLIIPGGNILPVYPYQHAIVPKTNTITLKASTADPFALPRRYILQLDTNDGFNNPVYTSTITSPGGVIEWNVNLPFPDSTVYYWRVSRDSLSPAEPYIWNEHSFQTIGNKRGWGQAHFFQFKDNTYRFVKFKRPQRLFEFENDINIVSVRTGVYPYLQWDYFKFFVNNINYMTGSCVFNGWSFAVFDSISGQPWSVLASPNTGLLPPFNTCGCYESKFYNYFYGQICKDHVNPWNYQQDMTNFLNAIPPNNYVLAYTFGMTGNIVPQLPRNYTNATFSAFESFGSANIRNVSDTVPHIIFGRKGMLPGQAKEFVGRNQQSVLQMTDSIRTKWNSGYIASERIGPSARWNSLHWRLKPYDATPGDTTILKVVGIRSNGQIDTLATFKSDSLDVPNLSLYADASLHPFLQLVAVMKDNVNRTSPQMKRWQVLYDEAPECAINPKKGFKVLKDSLQEGDEVTFIFPIENVGIKAFTDSLGISYWIEDKNRVKHNLAARLKARPFLPGAVIYDTIKVNTLGYVGANSLWIEINSPFKPRYQYEQYHFNNLANYRYSVSKDITNPLLDVTFDGIRILNGDMVSSKPNILVTLKDENKYLALNDTAAFQVFLGRPNQSTTEQVFFNGPLRFTPARLPDNSCRIEYNPELLQDGKYTLVVQGRDRSKNNSGSSEYRIQFVVENKPTVTNVMNYPNPFSTKTQFVFTLSGSEIPEVFTIQIMTISGKVVREITRSELGPLRIGRNITEYAWDGKDEFGDKLGNGVYLYKVITKLNGQSIEKRSTEADKYFVKEFGKMVIMR
ncbi:MAG: C25 family cysteine peptidase [Sediminibacterium sp.]|nr:C25 family cysteine peptidase [Sediminibacterium sp.]